MQLAIFQTVMTTLATIGYALIVGVLAAHVWLHRIDRAACCGIRTALSRALGAGLAVGAGATLLSLWQASATMADVPLFDSGPGLWAMFAGTAYGRFGLASFAMLALGAAVHFCLRRRLQGAVCHAVIACVLLFYAVCRAASGHAAESGLFSLAAAVELAHGLAMALWLGSVLVAAWVVLPDVAALQSPVMTATYLAWLSRWATVALAVVLATGLYNASRVLNAPAELATTAYGWVLTTKLCFVALAIALGAWNRFVGFPAAVAAGARPGAGASDLRAISIVLRIESVVLALVLFAAAILTTSAPPAST